MAIVEFEHRHCLLISQRGMRAAEAFELLFIESGQAIIKRLVFGMRSRYERHSTTGHYVNVVARHIKMLDIRVYFKSKRELKLNILVSEKKSML